MLLLSQRLGWMTTANQNYFMTVITSVLTKDRNCSTGKYFRYCVFYSKTIDTA